MTNLAPKLIQHIIAIGSIKNLDTGSYFAINFVTNLAPKLIQHIIAIESTLLSQQLEILIQAHILQ